MEEFIKRVTGSLGIDEETARTAIAEILGLIERWTAPGDFALFMDKLPGASALLEQSGLARPSEGDMLGGLMRNPVSLLGSEAAATGLTEQLRACGLNPYLAGTFVARFVGFVIERAGRDLAEKLLGRVPDLAEFLG